MTGNRNAGVRVALAGSQPAGTVVLCLLSIFRPLFITKPLKGGSDELDKRWGRQEGMITVELAWQTGMHTESNVFRPAEATAVLGFHDTARP